MATQTFMVYHPGGVPENVVSIQSGSAQVCADQLERWQRKEGDVYALGYFSSEEDAYEFIREHGYKML